MNSTIGIILVMALAWWLACRISDNRNSQRSNSNGPPPSKKPPAPPSPPPVIARTVHVSVVMRKKK